MNAPFHAPTTSTRSPPEPGFDHRGAQRCFLVLLRRRRWRAAQKRAFPAPRCRFAGPRRRATRTPPPPRRPRRGGSPSIARPLARARVVASALRAERAEVPRRASPRRAGARLPVAKPAPVAARPTRRRHRRRAPRRHASGAPPGTPRGRRERGAFGAASEMGATSERRSVAGGRPDDFAAAVGRARASSPSRATPSTRIRLSDGALAFRSVGIETGSRLVVLVGVVLRAARRQPPRRPLWCRATPLESRIKRRRARVVFFASGRSRRSSSRRTSLPSISSRRTFSSASKEGRLLNGRPPLPPPLNRRPRPRPRPRPPQQSLLPRPRPPQQSLLPRPRPRLHPPRAELLPRPRPPQQSSLPRPRPRPRPLNRARFLVLVLLLHLVE